MSRYSWREECEPIIAAAIVEGEAAGLDGRALLALIRERYPWGERAGWPYKVWLSEVRRQTQRLPFPRPAPRPPDLDGQGRFF